MISNYHLHFPFLKIPQPMLEFAWFFFPFARTSLDKYKVLYPWERPLWQSLGHVEPPFTVYTLTEKYYRENTSPLLKVNCTYTEKNTALFRTSNFFQSKKEKRKISHMVLYILWMHNSLLETYYFLIPLWRFHFVKWRIWCIFEERRSYLPRKMQFKPPFSSISSSPPLRKKGTYAFSPFWCAQLGFRRMYLRTLPFARTETGNMRL